ncbi:MAG: indolepyruvate ferredoxin oxidoreductase subunit alpha [Methanothermobacter sp.]|jgi:indolepyruvate ferredoxin oxidoreductase alpha subunit|nr:indolepyruvate ferredoxin oxidoreductase subunit alpha [Methanobacteriales archaeon]MDX9693326.1 indolepyruvate ferredoxin oxidoreductase subunit alpha [Methanothermobacter sp.]
MTKILEARDGDELFLLGNEAAARAAIESGVAVASTYPGTPSSEIGDVLSRIASKAGLYFEFSTNEKVAVEVAAAAAASGVRSFTFMKHVGLNVASDSLISIAYTGVEAGMVILSADDPSMFSSQNEQDNRHYASFANIPLLEPSNPQEILDFTKYAFNLSEKFKIPVLVRTTTRVSHMRSRVKVGEIKKMRKKGQFKKNPKRFVLVPSTARTMHKQLIKKTDKISKIVNKSQYNQIHHKTDSKYGIITSGGAFNYAHDLINEKELPISILKLGFTYPFPHRIVSKFLEDLQKVFIIEEVDPIIEKNVLSIIGQENLEVDVHGKLDGTFPRIYEYNQDIIEASIGKQIPLKIERKKPLKPHLPERPPTFCPGCPHRATYYSINKALEKLETDAIFSTDIGCYTLGIESPYNTADYLLSMGSSIGAACGFSKATRQKIVSFIGDSTFFHAGIPPLLNAVHNKHDFLIVILDNRTTAMTGGQPHPGLPFDGMGSEAPAIPIENIVEALGIKFKVINPMNIKKSIKTFKDALTKDSLNIVIARYPCQLTIKAKGKPVKVDNNLCNECLECINKLACPAIIYDNGIKIDHRYCRGCAVCIQICPEKAIKPERGSSR